MVINYSCGKCGNPIPFRASAMDGAGDASVVLVRIQPCIVCSSEGQKKREVLEKTLLNIITEASTTEDAGGFVKGHIEHKDTFSKIIKGDTHEI